MLILGVILFLAFLVESMVEYLFGQLFDRFPAWAPYRWLLMYVAAAIGVGGAFFYGFDLLYILGNWLDASKFLAPTWLGMLFTGLAIGRGSNYLHDLVTRFFVKEK